MKGKWGASTVDFVRGDLQLSIHRSFRDTVLCRRQPTSIATYQLSEATSHHSGGVEPHSV